MRVGVSPTGERVHWVTEPGRFVGVSACKIPVMMVGDDADYEIVNCGQCLLRMGLLPNVEQRKRTHFATNLIAYLQAHEETWN